MAATVKLQVNVDHVATLRQARGTPYPDPVEAAAICERAGADGITVHLREDRRHIQDRDVEVLRRTVETLLNLEMAATEPMIAFAARIRPDLVTLVPERREERTTEGGLDVAGRRAEVEHAIRRLREVGVPVSLFIAPDEAQVRASAAAGAYAIELHTGEYAHAAGEDVRRELARLAAAAKLARSIAPSMVIAAGHGLTEKNVRALVAGVPEIAELNIGHALVSDAVLVGMAQAVILFREAIAEAATDRS
jgi:pyridoxine 5-phosphate synthase